MNLLEVVVATMVLAGMSAGNFLVWRTALQMQKDAENTRRAVTVAESLAEQTIESGRPTAETNLDGCSAEVAGGSDDDGNAGFWLVARCGNAQETLWIPWDVSALPSAGPQQF